MKARHALLRVDIDSIYVFREYNESFLDGPIREVRERTRRRMDSSETSRVLLPFLSD